MCVSNLFRDSSIAVLTQTNKAVHYFFMDITNTDAFFNFKFHSLYLYYYLLQSIKSLYNQNSCSD